MINDSSNGNRFLSPSTTLGKWTTLSIPEVKNMKLMMEEINVICVLESMIYVFFDLFPVPRFWL